MTKPVQQARLFVKQEMQSPLVEPCLDGLVGVFSARCPGKVTANEDAAAVVVIADDQAMLAVADGLGGGPDGEKASRLALQHLRHEVQLATTTGALLRTAIINGLEAANRAVMRIGRGAATTIAAVEIQNNVLRPYHVGDSVILVMSNRGRVKHESVSHSPVGYGVEAGMLDQRTAMHHENRHLVSNVVGCPKMRIEIGPEIRLSPRDTVLVASDGLVDNLTIDEIVQQGCKGKLAAAVQQLADSALYRMRNAERGRPSKPDDLTLILFRPTRPQPRTSAAVIATGAESPQNVVVETPSPEPVLRPTVESS